MATAESTVELSAASFALNHVSLVALAFVGLIVRRRRWPVLSLRYFSAHFDSVAPHTEGTSVVAVLPRRAPGNRMIDDVQRLIEDSTI